VGWLGKSANELQTIRTNMDKLADAKVAYPYHPCHAVYASSQVSVAQDPTGVMITIAARTLFMFRWAIENYRIILKLSKAAAPAALLLLNKRAKVKILMTLLPWSVFLLSEDPPSSYIYLKTLLRLTSI